MDERAISTASGAAVVDGATAAADMHYPFTPSAHDDVVTTSDRNVLLLRYLQKRLPMLVVDSLGGRLVSAPARAHKLWIPLLTRSGAPVVEGASPLCGPGFNRAAAAIGVQH